jgi:hypothetical protein
MIEIVKVLLQALDKMIQVVPEARRKRHLRNIGLWLFRLYFELNEILACAEGIVYHLEQYAERARAKDSVSWVIDELRGLLSVQQYNLIRVGRLLQSEGMVLLALDAGVARDIGPLLDRKTGRIHQLTESFSVFAVNYEATPDIAAMLQLDPHPPYGGKPGSPAYERGEADYFDAFKMGKREAVLAHVSMYLDVQRPRERIAEVSDLAVRMRLAMASCFTIEDMLLAAHRIGSENDK